MPTAPLSAGFALLALLAAASFAAESFAASSLSASPPRAGDLTSPIFEFPHYPAFGVVGPCP